MIKYTYATVAGIAGQNKWSIFTFHDAKMREWGPVKTLAFILWHRALRRDVLVFTDEGHLL